MNRLLSSKRSLHAATILIVVSGATVLWLAKPWIHRASNPTYTTVSVEHGAIAAQISASGTVSARRTVQVGAQASGRIVELGVDYNDHVTKGQLLARLDDSVLQSMVLQARAMFDQAVAAVEKAQASLMDANRQLKRQTTLREQQLIAAATLEASQTALDSALANLVAANAAREQARASLAQAQTNLSYARIYSPIDGVVLSRSVDVGQTVQSAFAAPTLFTIAEDLSRMQIDTAVAESDIGRLSAGMKATFTVDAYPSRTFDAIVRQVRNAPTTTAGVVTYDAVIDVDNPDHLLRPGMTTNVMFTLERVASVVKVPNAALRFKPSRTQLIAMMSKVSGLPPSGGPPAGAPGGGPPGGGPPGLGGFPPSGSVMPGSDRASDRKIVWKLEGGTPRPVPIKSGLTDGNATEMLEGMLVPGDQLITEILGVVANTTIKPPGF